LHTNVGESSRSLRHVTQLDAEATDQSLFSVHRVIPHRRLLSPCPPGPCVLIISLGNSLITPCDAVRVALLWWSRAFIRQHLVAQRPDFNCVWRGVDRSRTLFGDEDDVDSEANHPVAFLAPCVTRRARHSLQAGWLAHTCLVLLSLFISHDHLGKQVNFLVALAKPFDLLYAARRALMKHLTLHVCLVFSLSVSLRQSCR
jgi:hypothetical protein